jgi:UDP-N-acetylmuramate: L-alanyl-gamma-D-glutamyl-meso-diaminopimelate ligase
VMSPSNPRKTIHLIGICGVGMGSLAGLLKAAGHSVRGSDQNVYPPMSTKLEAWGIPIVQGFSEAHLDPRPDLVVVGNVIRKDNVEAQAAMTLGIPYASFPEVLRDEFLVDKHSVVVAGTHGKTTTTSLIAWLLAYAGLDPGFLIGGIPGNFPESFHVGSGTPFVVEGDEYDTAFFDKGPKFLHYQARTLVLTSLEFDHADIYENVEAIETQFARLVAGMPKDGQIIQAAAAHRLTRITQEAPCAVIRYGAASVLPDAEWRAVRLTTDEHGTSFDVEHFGQVWGPRFSIGLAGEHNVENALAAIVVATNLGVDLARIAEGLRRFRGVSRRQDVRAVVDGVRIIDDFAHHPTAVRASVSAIRARFPRGKLIAVFEPRTATSARKHFQEAYAEAFDQADETIIASVGRKELPASDRLDVNQLVEAIRGRGLKATHIPEVPDIVEHLTRTAQPEDTILFMSNGAFGGIYAAIEQALASRSKQV